MTQPPSVSSEDELACRRVLCVLTDAIATAVSDMRADANRLVFSDIMTQCENLVSSGGASFRFSKDDRLDDVEELVAVMPLCSWGIAYASLRARDERPRSRATLLQFALQQYESFVDGFDRLSSLTERSDTVQAERRTVAEAREFVTKLLLASLSEEGESKPQALMASPSRELTISVAVVLKGLSDEVAAAQILCRARDVKLSSRTWVVIYSAAMLIAFKEVVGIARELEMLRYRSKLEEEGASDSRVDHKNRSGPENRFSVDSLRGENSGSILGQGGNSGKPWFVRIGGPAVRTDVKSAVFRPDILMPTKSLAEAAEEEMQFAIKSETNKGEKKGQMNSKSEIGGKTDSDVSSSESSDEKYTKSRAWDDWKDENPRGSGNKMHNRG